MAAPAYEYLALRNIFTKYGDTDTGRNLATLKFRQILSTWFGEMYEFNFYGNAVDSQGRITKQLYDVFQAINSTVDPSPNDGTYTRAAIAAVESQNLLNITFIKQKSPIYVYPWYYEYRLLPYNAIDRHLFLPKGIQNLKYGGSKLTGASINSNSTQTIDGGPVVKVTRVNQNQVVFSNNTVTTARANTSGLPVRILTSADTGRLADTKSKGRPGGN